MNWSIGLGSKINVEGKKEEVEEICIGFLRLEDLVGWIGVVDWVIYVGVIEEVGGVCIGFLWL